MSSCSITPSLQFLQFFFILSLFILHPLNHLCALADPLFFFFFLGRKLWLSITVSTFITIPLLTTEGTLKHGDPLFDEQTGSLLTQLIQLAGLGEPILDYSLLESDLCPGMSWYFDSYVYRKLIKVRSANYQQMPAVSQLSEICLVSPPHCVSCKAKPLNDRCCCLNIQWQKCLVNHQ